MEMKEALVVLLPKKKGKRTPEDYRPITLLNSVYKILDKILATRLTEETRTKRSCTRHKLDLLLGDQPQIRYSN